MKKIRQRNRPCAACPWRTDLADDVRIPTFDADKARRLRRTCEQSLDAPLMACHESLEGQDYVCAGYLLSEGTRSLRVRMAVSRGMLNVSDLDRSVPVHETVDEMIDAVIRREAT